MQQYFIDNVAQCEGIVLFNEEQAHHIRHVMRMREQEIVKIVDASGNPFLVHIHYEANQVCGIVMQALEKKPKPLHITLVQGLIKKDKWDFLIQKCTELGVDVIVPMASSRTIVKLEKDDTKKIARYNKIARSAAEQCKRDTLVQVLPIIRFQEIKAYKSELNILAYENEDHSFKQVLRSHADVQSITFVVGSEGGFSREEAELLKEDGFISISLGNHILRAETAAMDAIAIAQYELTM